jgi:hypothetical protein
MEQILLSIFKTGKNAQINESHGVYGKRRANCVYNMWQSRQRPVLAGFIKFQACAGVRKTGNQSLGLCNSAK